MRFDDEDIGGKEIGPIRFEYKGEIPDYLFSVGRQLLGRHKNFMQFQQLKFFKREYRTDDGARFIISSNKNGLADVDNVYIEAPMLGIIIYGFIVMSPYQFYMILPDGEIAGNYDTYGGNGMGSSDWDVWDATPVVGYNDYGAHYSTLTQAPEYQIITMNEYTTGSSWDIYDTCANIPPPAPAIDNSYSTSLNIPSGDTNSGLFRRRTDGRGLWTGSYVEIDPANLNLTDVNIPSTYPPVDEEPYYNLGHIGFMVPMNATRFYYTPELWAYNNWDYSYDTYTIDLDLGNNTPECPFEWKIWTHHIWEKGAMPSQSFGVDLRVDNGTYKIRNQNWAYKKFKVWLMTNKGNVTVTFDYPEGSPTYINQDTDLIQIKVGEEVDTIEQAISWIGP